ncbi:hypothetical protein ISCGN_024117 [Ixodes scapularis]
MEALVLSCTAIRGATSLEFSWYKDGELATRRALPQMLSDTVSTLTIAKVGAEDLGNYTCRASNAVGSDSYTAALTVAGKPDIMPFSFSKNSVLGQTSTLSCVASSGQGPFRFLWTHDGKAIEDTPRKHVRTVSDNVALMTIERITAEDSGNYTCIVSNAVGSGSYSAALAVEEKPEIMPFTFSKNVLLGQKTMVTCAVTTGSTPLEFLWSHNGRAVDNTASKYAASVTSNIATMTIQKVSAEDTGNYTCTVSNDVGSDSYTSALLVEELPKIQPFSFPTNHPLGKDVVVSCFAMEGQQPLTFHWFKDGRRITSNTKLVIEHISGKMATLAIREVAAEDIGNYTCQVSNAIGSDKVTSDLVVTDVPRIQPFNFPKTEQMPKKVIVHCAVLEGREPFKFTWLKDGVTLVSGRKLQVKILSEALSSLTILDVGAEDIGNYTCTVSNSAGSDRFTSELLVTEGQQPLTFQWFKDGRPINTNAKLTIELMSGKMATLTVHEVSAEDIGNYTCQVSNGAGSDKFTSDLVVNGVPKLQPFIFPNQQQMPKKVVVHCVVLEGDEPFKFSWLKDGIALASNRKVQVKVSEAVSSLTITTVDAEDIGNYTCVVRNAAGSDSFTSQLLVTDDPQPQSLDPISSSNVRAPCRTVTRCAHAQFFAGVAFPKLPFLTAIRAD